MLCRFDQTKARWEGQVGVLEEQEIPGVFMYHLLVVMYWFSINVMTLNVL